MRSSWGGLRGPDVRDTAWSPPGTGKAGLRTRDISWCAGSPWMGVPVGSRSYSRLLSSGQKGGHI